MAERKAFIDRIASMKRLSITLLVALTLAGTSIYAQNEYDDSLLKHRVEKDEELKSRKHSPLQKVDRKAFDHLNYFESDQSWKKTAKFIPIENGEVLDIMTSANRPKQFQRYGYLIFEHHRIDTLVAYKRVWPKDYVSPYPPSLFVPFKDLTTGNETYGGGRYMDLEIPDAAGEVELDFNYCYNPYCAYGGGFSCPIPPIENFVDAPVQAGEKGYNAGH